MQTQNDFVLKNALNDPLNFGYNQMDEPDNAQSDHHGGYLPCVDPNVTQALYKKWKAADPKRPIFQGLGQGVAYTLKGSKISRPTIRWVTQQKAKSPLRTRPRRCVHRLCRSSKSHCGKCRNKTDMYAEYAKAADIVAFDIYPVNAEEPEVSNKLWLPAQGVLRIAT